jgi:hypothetical protein
VQRSIIIVITVRRQIAAGPSTALDGGELTTNNIDGVERSRDHGEKDHGSSPGVEGFRGPGAMSTVCFGELRRGKPSLELRGIATALTFRARAYHAADKINDPRNRLPHQINMTA